MEVNRLRPKLQQLRNFLLDPDSDESKNYISDLLSGGTKRPEDLFVQKFLNVEFWREMGFKDNEIKIEYPAGASGRVEITLNVEGQKIGIECKKPYVLKNSQAFKHELDGNDIKELENQISYYLLSHTFIIFTNGFHWFFYSRDSYRSWLIGGKKKDSSVKPYFEHLTAEVLLDEKSSNYILNVISRENITAKLMGIEYESIRHVLTDEFFEDLKSWISIIDIALRKAPVNLKARTTALINKLIFVRTMEDVGIVHNGFLAGLWDNKKGAKNSPVNFIDHIDDELSEIYDTELFTSKYITDENGQPVLKEGVPEYSNERRKNFAYSALPDSFLTAIFRPIEPTNLMDTGMSKISLDGKEYHVRSLYWWKFGSITGDILGKAYETYLARERKKLGIYYTPHQMTEYLTRNTIDIVFDEKIAELKLELSKEHWDKDRIRNIANRIREIRICDPSCGSGSFLIQAIRAIWSKYTELDRMVRELEKKYSEGKSVLDEYFTDKVSIIRYLEVLFRVRDRRERMGTMILRHIYGNDKDIKAVDTAKLNIWLECIRLDPNAYRKNELKSKRHVLPNLELNITDGDSLIGLNTDDATQLLSGFKDSIKSIFKLKEGYTESFDKTNLVQEAVRIKTGLQGFLDTALTNRLGDELGSKIMRLLKPTHWPIQHLDSHYTDEGEQKPENDRGFDAIIGNPPWEVLKPESDDFFGTIYAETHEDKFTLLTDDKKKMFIALCKKNPTIEQDWQAYKRNIETQMKYYQSEQPFKHQAGEIDGRKTGGDINLYKLFVEQYYNLLKKDGVCGVVLPGNLYSDLAAKGLRKLLFESTTILTLYGFDNQKGIFDEIHRQFKFIMFLFRKSGTTKRFRANFYLRDLSKIPTLDQGSYRYNIELLAITSPKSLSVIECKSDFEEAIVRHIYSFPLLLENPEIAFTNEFHMTKYAPLFNQTKKGKPLFEAKMMHQFTHQLREPRYWIEEVKAIRDLKSREEKRTKHMLKKLGLDKKEGKQSFQRIQLDYEYHRIAWRNISRSTDQRTMICTILPPKVFLGNSLNYVRPIYFDGRKYSEPLSAKEMAFVCGLFNSYIIDFILRRKISINLNMFYVKELPLPKFNPNNRYHHEIVDKVGELICTTSEFDSLKKKLGVTGTATDLVRRQRLIAQVNACAATIYNLTRDELEYVLSTFPIVNAEARSNILIEFDKICPK